MVLPLLRSAPARSIRLCTLACLSLLQPGCTTLNTGGVTTRFNLVVQSNVDNTKNHLSSPDPFSVSASCKPGQQMVGGGYNLINNSHLRTLVVVEGNYPSAPATWTVRVRNPDDFDYNGDEDVAVFALAYCVTTPNFDLGTEIVVQTAQIPHTSEPTDIVVWCSQPEGLVLSGGFLTSSLPRFRVSDPGVLGHTYWPGLRGTGIVASFPTISYDTYEARGWSVTQQYTPAFFQPGAEEDVTTSVFAICARKGIVAGHPHRVVAADGYLGWDESHIEAHCEKGEFTVGGGYSRFRLIPDTGEPGIAVTERSVAVPFDGWRIVGDSLGNDIYVLALCVRIPVI